MKGKYADHSIDELLSLVKTAKKKVQAREQVVTNTTNIIGCHDWKQRKWGPTQGKRDIIQIKHKRQSLVEAAFNSNFS